ncbi:hypothetical protein Leryth_014227 [Lithospermum erythrorhizon]|nr:hypothetical protein Leryth_014227 [Lithospermum erythrorhizon]
MENPNSTHLQQEHSSSRFTNNNLTFFISSIFIFIVGAIVSVSYMIKLENESQSLSSNPSKAILEVCRLCHYFDLKFDFSSSWIEDQELKSKYDNHELCFDSISSLHSQNYTNTINPSMIFYLSLQVAITKIKNLHKEPALKENCDKLLNESQSQLHVSLTKMRVDPNDSILRDDKLVNDMKSLIKNALDDAEGCLTRVKGKRFGRLMGLKEIMFKIKITKSYLVV